MDGHYSIKQTAEILSINPATVRNWLKSGKITGVMEKRGKGMDQWWIPVNDVERALEAQQPQDTPEQEAKEVAAIAALPEVDASITPVKRSFTPEELAEIAKTVKVAALDAVQEVVRTELEEFREKLESRANERDQKLMEVIRSVQTAKQKTWVQRLLGK